MNPERLFQLLNTGAAGGAAAIRSIAKLQPSGGIGDKAFPPTYADGKYAREKRLIDGQEVETVLLDSAQSMANRYEEVLAEAVQSNSLALPLFKMNVAGHEITTLNAPHRVHDAIFRDSLWDGVPFRESPNGKRLVAARSFNATAFFEFAPTVLLFGTWDSQSGGGVNSAKIARCLVSEIIGIQVVPGVRTSSRIDPLGIKLIRNVIDLPGKDATSWRFVDPPTEPIPAKDIKKTKRDEPKGVRPSEINHGNIAPSIVGPDGPGGVTMREAQETAVLSLAQLRKLRFPDGKALATSRDVAGRTVIAALGLHAVALMRESGYQLRSRCQLLPAEKPSYELIGPTQNDREVFELTSETTSETLAQALTAAKEQGLKWNAQPIRLEPKPDLFKLVELSDRSVSDAEQG